MEEDGGEGWKEEEEDGGARSEEERGGFLLHFTNTQSRGIN